MGTCFVVSTVYQGYSAISLAKEKLRHERGPIYLLDCTHKGDFSRNNGRWLENLEVIRLSEFYSKNFYARCIFSRKIFLSIGSGVLKNVEKLYIYNDRDPFSLYFSKQVSRSGGEVTLVEEGLSMYRQATSYFSFQMIKDQLKNLLFMLFSGLYLNFRFGFSRYTHKLMLSNADEFKRRFPESKKALITYNVDFSDEHLNQLFMKEYVDYNADDCFPQVDIRVFVYFGQPLSELGLVCETSEMDLIRNVRNVIENQGYKFLLKSHPKDRKGKYSYLNLGANLIDSIVPVEVLMRFYDVDVVGSFSSSASYNFTDSDGVKSLIFSKILGKDYGFPKKNYLIEIENLEHLDSVFGGFN
jgi:hypothetical protein